MKMARAHLVITGHVQGVCFRAATTDEARQMGLTGRVWNNPDRSVEAIVEGPEDAVKSLVGWCHHGPPAARVDGVEVSWEDYLGEHQDFSATLTPSRW